MASEHIKVGAAANDGTGDTLRDAFIDTRKMFHEIYGISDTYSDSLDYSGKAFRYNKAGNDQAATTGTATFDCATGSVFKMSSSLTGTIDITLTNYLKGHVVTIWNLTGSQTVNLRAGTGTGVFYKIGGDYTGASVNVLQIECIDDQAANPQFFYTVSTYSDDPNDI